MSESEVRVLGERLERLSVEMAKGFEAVRQEFKEVREEFREVRRELRDVHDEFKRVHQDIGELRGGVGELRGRVSTEWAIWVLGVGVILSPIGVYLLEFFMGR